MLNIENAGTMRASFVDAVRPGADVLVQYLGTSELFIQAPFHGTLAAPNALVNLQTVAAPGHSGVFLTKSIEVSPTGVTRQPFDPSCQ
jgi:hypothetical protein